MYNPKRTTCLMLMIAFLSLIQAQTTVIERRDDFCNGDIPNIDMTVTQFESLRDERDNIFSDNYKEVFNYYADDDVGQLFESFLPWAILLLILMGFCFLSLIVFVVLACGKYKKEDNRTGIYTAFGCLLFWLFVGLFATIVVFIGKATHRYNRVHCTLYDVPATLIGGVDTDVEKFLGLQNIQTMLTNFKGDLTQMTSLSGAFDTIFTSNTPSTTNAAWSSLVNFVSTYENTRIQNGAGVIATPNTIRKLSPSVSEEVATDFVSIDLTAQRMQLTAEEGRRYQIDSYRNTVSTTLDATNAKLTTLINELNTIFNSVTDHAETAIDYSIIGYWVLFGLCCGAVFLGFIILTVLCCVCTWQRCHKGLFFSRLLLVLLGIVAVCTAVICFILMIGSVSGSSFCGFVAEINRGNFNVFNQIDQNVSDDVIDVFRTCSLTSQTGDLSTVLLETAAEREAYGSVTRFFDGLLAYNYYSQNMSEETGSKGIENQVDTWTQYQQGLLSDFRQVDTTLEQLNDLIDCNDDIFFLTSALCVDIGNKNCFGILESDSYTAPSCSDNATVANQNFLDLKSYMTEEQALMTSLINNLSDTTTLTPNTRFINSKIALNNLSQPYNAIANSVSSSLGIADDYNVTQSELVDCRAFRHALLKFEEESCLNFNHYIYVILVLGAVCACLLFLLTWCLCCGLRETGNYEEVSVIEDPYMDKHVIKEAGDVIDFEEREIIPNY